MGICVVITRDVLVERDCNSIAVLLLLFCFSVMEYSGTSLIRSPVGLGKSDLNGEVTLLQGANLHFIIQFGTEQG